MSASPSLHDTLVQLSEGRSLTEGQAEETFRAVLSGRADEAQIGALLGLLALKRVTADELVGAARAMRSAVLRVPIPDALREGLVDTCGTGGAPKTFNISTAAAIAAAAAGQRLDRPVRVAKHGSKSRTGRGSSEVMRQLGVDIDASPEQQARCLAECGVCFSFAINHHPAMKHAAGPRRSIGFPSIFNLLGPLTNPAGAERQLMGVYGEDKLELVGQALRRLGARHAWVVHARDGLDEISTTAPTLVAHVTPEAVKIVEMNVEKMGLARASLDDLRETTLEGAAARIRSVLRGEPGPARDIVAINAAAAVLLAGAAGTLKAALDAVRGALDSGAGVRTLEEMARLSHEPA